MSTFTISLSRTLNRPAVAMAFIWKPLHHVGHYKDLNGKDVEPGAFTGAICFEGIGQFQRQPLTSGVARVHAQLEQLARSIPGKANRCSHPF